MKLEVDAMPAVGIDPHESGLVPLNFAELFGNAAPVVIEIGSGKGRFLLEAARERPGVNFIGIEKSLHYFRVVVDRIVRAGLSNVRVINHDAYEVFARMFDRESAGEIHIYFPDPWPRPRERKRRLIRPEVAAELERVMHREGAGYYVTDHHEYFEKAVPVLQERFDVRAGEVDPARPPRTNYEAKYRVEGRAIYEATFRRRS